ncbi:MAG: Helix-turn-helix domain protein [Chloroflexi bacterium ADurb.Bin325]|nr:MAG: Helix-turn-helix domain protein [Chloroflexi bacterium ADurb.Bin325]
MADNELDKTLGDQLQPTRRRILLALKQRGRMTATELAELLGITSMGVRRHLTTLERDRLVDYELMQRGKGRPSYVYRLTAQAENLFPKNYAGLAKELLGYLANRDSGSEVIQLFDQRADRRIRQARAQLEGKSLAERVAGLADILHNDGYLADWQQVDANTFLLREHNCAVHEVAAEFRAACHSELNFLRAILPDADITREEHLMAGGLSCTYRIRRIA